MRTQSAAEQDPAVGLTPPIQPRSPWRITSVEAMPDFHLHLRFVDGTEGVVDLSSLIRSPEAGVFASLADPAVFAEAKLAYGAVIWPGDIDLAPDALYAQIRRSR